MENRLDEFETMLKQVQLLYDQTVAKMAVLKAEGKVKTVTYRELMGTKLLYQSMLDLYRAHKLID